MPKKKKKYKGPIRVTVTISSDIHDELITEADRQSKERGEHVSIGRVMREWLDASAEDDECNPLGAHARAGTSAAVQRRIGTKLAGK